MRGERSAAFCKRAALFVNDAKDAALSAHPFADGSYQGPIRFDGLDTSGHARFSRMMYSDKAHTLPRTPVKWTESPSKLFAILRGELRWDAVGLPKLEQDPHMAPFLNDIVGAVLPSAWLKAAEAMSAAPRRSISVNVPKKALP